MELVNCSSVDNIAPISKTLSVFTSNEPESYKVQINYVAGSETSVEIFNIFNGGQKITGTYNKADGTLVIPTDQIVMLHPSYGEVLMKGVDDAIENYTKTISCSFTMNLRVLYSGNRRFVMVE